jgi:hypothetical protein
MTGDSTLDTRVPGRSGGADESPDPVAGKVYTGIAGARVFAMLELSDAHPIA